MTIEQRLEKLERTVRRYQLAFGILGLALLATTAIACSQQALASQNNAAIPEVIRARKFEVVGRNGKTTATMDTFKFSTGREYGHIGVYNDRNIGICSISANDDGGGNISLTDGAFRGTQLPPSGARISASPKNGGFIVMKNRFGKAVFYCGSDTTNVGSVSVRDVNGQPRASLP